MDEGDGSIDRVFPVAGREEITEFTHLFKSRATKDLTDGHLWFSVALRPSRSPFTRVQRLSCCLSLLLCTMMANAMWYKTDEGRYTKADLGPFSFSWEQIIIGISSSLIVFPINLILVQIFRNCRSKPNTTSPVKKKFNRKVIARGSGINIMSFTRTDLLESSSETSETSVKFDSIDVMENGSMYYDSSMNQSSCVEDDKSATPRKESPKCVESRKLQTKKASKKCLLPWWFTYIAWTLVILTSLSAATVTLLYGISFGKKKS